jgi:hypothetical protein
LPFGARPAALAGEAAARSGEVGCTKDHQWTIAGCDPDSARGKAGGNSHPAYGQATVSLPLKRAVQPSWLAERGCMGSPNGLWPNTRHRIW